MRTRNHSLSTVLSILTTVFFVGACASGRGTEKSPADETRPTAETSQTKPEPAKTKSVAAQPKANKAPAKQAPKPVASAKPNAPQAAPAKTVVHAAPAPKAEEPAPATAERLVRYVNVDVLNVRLSPRDDAPVIAKIARGSMFTVTVMGEWAKLSDGQFVLAKFLSKTQPALPTKHLAARK